FCVTHCCAPTSTLFPYTTLFRSIEIGLKHCLLAGGFWRPNPNTLRSIREGIDYDGEVLQEILDKPSFKKTFGSLYEDEKLTNARSEEHTLNSSHVKISYAVFCLK